MGSKRNLIHRYENLLSGLTRAFPSRIGPPSPRGKVSSPKVSAKSFQLFVAKAINIQYSPIAKRSNLPLWGMGGGASAGMRFRLPSSPAPKGHTIFPDREAILPSPLGKGDRMRTENARNGERYLSPQTVDEVPIKRAIRESPLLACRCSPTWDETPIEVPFPRTKNTPADCNHLSGHSYPLYRFSISSKS